MCGLGAVGSGQEWRSIESGIASALVEVECLRTLDRLRLVEGVVAMEIVRRREAVYRILDSVTVVDVTRPILARALPALAVALGTLDAIHLATATLWREQSAAALVMATHDAALGLAARSVGFRVIGV